MTPTPRHPAEPRSSGSVLPRLLALIVARLLAAPGLASAAEPGASTAGRKVDFNREVRPILAKNCFACHGQDEAKRAKGLRLDVRESAIKPLKSGETAIVPGDPDSSELIARITEEDETLRMPPRKTGNRLTPAEVDVLRRWIEQGAEYARHWALIPPESLPLPKVRDTAWPRNGIDFWILAPAGAGGPEALARGRPLHAAPPGQPGPPRPAADARGGRALRPATRPRTPTSGPSTASSTTRPTASDGRGCGSTWPVTPTRPATAPTRSGPTSGGIATGSSTPSTATSRTTGSPSSRSPATCCPNPSLEDRIATAFHRNTMTNTEGGTDDEEFRVAADQGPGRHHDAGLDGADHGLRQVPQPQVSTRSPRRSITASTPSSTRRPTTTSPTRGPDPGRRSPTPRTSSIAAEGSAPGSMPAPWESSLALERREGWPRSPDDSTPAEAAKPRPRPSTFDQAPRSRADWRSRGPRSRPCR